jgi:hypothetical protein
VSDLGEEEPVSAGNQESSVEEPVLVATHRIDPELLPDVQDACIKAHARYVPWSGELGLRDLRKTPAVLVTGLRVGERRIPEDVLDLATNSYPDLALLVLCRETLLRPTMSLNNGRVTLVSPPLTSPRVASVLRSLLSDRHVGYASTDTATGHLGPRSPVNVRRYRRADYWVGVLSSGRVEGTAAKLPLVRQTKTDGLTIVLPRPGAIPELHMNAITAGFKRDRNGADRAASLEQALGEHGAALHLAPGADEWTVYWPHKHWPLFLSSPLRLPNVWNMCRSMERVGKNLLRFQAAHCDMLAALTCFPTTSDAAPDEATSNLASATSLMPSLGEGGAALFDFLERKTREQPADLVGAVVEVF